MNQLDLAGQHAVVTGAGSGIGLAIAQRLAASGATVTIWDLDVATATQAVMRLGLEAQTVYADVSDHASVLDALRKTTAIAQRIVVLVNSAGVTGPNARLCEYPIDGWRKVMDINVNGTFHCCREVGALMQRQGYGRIVNIASVAGKEGNPNASAYSASKAAVIGLTKSLGKELAGLDVMVNCVTPAAVKTAIFDQMTTQHIEFMLSKIPMGRFGQPEEVASLVAWLCTKECSFTTGAVFDLSGGRATY